MCPLCRDPESLDSQQHLLLCTSLADNNLTQLEGPAYSDLFSTEVLKQIAVATLLVERFKLRKELMKEKFITANMMQH